MPYADHPTPLDRYAARVRDAACQYRRDCATLSEVNAYTKLKSEQQRAMRELVTGEYSRRTQTRQEERLSCRVPARTGRELQRCDSAACDGAVTPAPQQIRPTEQGFPAELFV
jgi:hypothetical protein